MNWQELSLHEIIYGLLVLLIFTLPLSQLVSSGVFYCAFVLAMTERLRHGVQATEPCIPARLRYALGAFLILSAVSVVLSGSVMQSAYNWVWVVGQEAGAFWLLRQYGASKGRAVFLFKVLLCSAGIVAIYGLYQYFFDTALQDPEWIDREVFPELQRRAFATLENPNILGTFMVIIISYCTGLFLQLKSVKERRLVALLGFLCGMTLVFTFSRGNWVALVGALFFFATCFCRKALWPLVGGGVLTLCLFWNVVAHRILSIFVAEDTSAELRFAYIEGTLSMISEHPWGVGWYGYQFAFPDYDFYLMDPSVVMYHCHNLFLNIGSELGILGLCLFSYVIWLLFGQARLIESTADSLWARGIACGYMVALVGIGISGLTDYTLFNIRLGTLFWTTTALLLNLRK